MGDTGGVLSLQEYISSVEQSSLPRILQVCSGVYFQGSVYEISGSEVCLSTGDLVKITSFELLSVSCLDITNNTTFELPLDHSVRKNIVKFPSTLEVDIIDVTEECKHLTFVTPLSLVEVAAQPNEAFPTMAEILEGPVANTFFCCSWLKALQNGKHLVLHRCNKTRMVLASTPKGRKTQQYFLLSQDYGGQLRRRAREFSSVYEVYLAFSKCPGLTVTVMKHCEAVEEEGVPALSSGEQLEVLRLQTTNTSKSEFGAPEGVDNLIFKRIEDDDDDDDDDEEIAKITDKKKYSLLELCKYFSLPLDLKVVKHDKTMEKDPLAGLAALRLEDVLEETTVLASFPDTPEQCFELPVRWMQLSLSFISDPLPWPDSEIPGINIQTVTEVTENFYHEYQRLYEKPILTPPPRPPKRKSLTVQSMKASAKTKDVTVKSSHPIKKPDKPRGQTKRNPPPPPDEIEDVPPPLIPRKSLSTCLAINNTYVKAPKKKNAQKHKSERKSSDSDHDYEPVEDMLNAFDHIMSY
ncbi:hypothetical protein HF521_017757 [Silurus meridionalis]|uniref:CABIT domain-containing protein n=1 Tax=Silurus meridionalis TaxID=175797 RepID=A0A8T0BTQ6_SILME|nr:hypothetical protein HF521_017757 [Silurus meridionalis]